MIDRPIQTALVCEGGAMRGIFSAGVLDVFLEEKFEPFDLVIGTSAGACNLVSYLAHQHERNLRCYRDIMSRPQLFSFPRFLRGGHYIDLDWLWERFIAEDPLDQPAVDAHPAHLIAVATCARTGAPLYLEPRSPEIMEYLKGSSAMPMLYRGVVNWGGHEMADGGISDPIPVKKAYALGARKIVVIRSRPTGVTKKDGFEQKLTAFLTRNHPGIAKAIRETSVRAYGDAVAFCEKPPEDARIWQIAPPSLMKTGRTTQDTEILLADYTLGRRAAKEALKEIEGEF